MNTRIRNDVGERYLDATAAMFMEYYAIILAHDLQKEFESFGDNDVIFPDELDKRCRAMIKKEYASQKRKKYINSIMRSLRYVACCAVVLLALASILFVSVEAIRIPVINFYISQGGEYLKIGDSSEITADPVIAIDWNDPLVKFIPEGYSLSMCDGDHSTQLVAIYENSAADSIFFTIDPASDIKKIDSEDAQAIKECFVAGNEAIIIIKNGVMTLVWKHEVIGKTFSITATSLSEMEIIDIAEGVMQGIAS